MLPAFNVASSHVVLNIHQIPRLSGRLDRKYTVHRKTGEVHVSVDSDLIPFLHPMKLCLPVRSQ